MLASAPARLTIFVRPVCQRFKMDEMTSYKCRDSLVAINWEMDHCKNRMLVVHQHENTDLWWEFPPLRGGNVSHFPMILLLKIWLAGHFLSQLDYYPSYQFKTFIW